MSVYPRVLVIDDEAQIHRFLRAALQADGFEPLRADTGGAGLHEIAVAAPAAVVLDLGLPDMDGQAVLSKARAFYVGPIIILSARDRELEKIEALDAGADDYVEKPFGVGELLARLRVAVRKQRPAEEAPKVVRAGDLVVDLPRRLVTKAGEAVRLSPKEYDLLAELAINHGRVLGHRQLLAAVWGSERADVQYLRVYIGQLRQKLGAERIVSEPGVGYALQG